MLKGERRQPWSRSRAHHQPLRGSECRELANHVARPQFRRPFAATLSDAQDRARLSLRRRCPPGAAVNALKHADARNVHVRLDYDAQLLRLQTRDDGRGMQSGVAEAAAAGGHLGIAGMKARAQSAAGTMEILSEPGRGTTIRVSLPID
jgi:signal transduction histidine kinase